MLDVLVEDQSERLAILGDIGEARVDRVVDRIELDRAPFQRRRAGDVAAIGAAEHAHGEFRAAGAHEAGDPDDLAALDVQVDALHHLRGRRAADARRASRGSRTAPRRSPNCARG